MPFYHKGHKGKNTRADNKDEILIKALVRSLEIIGEASKKVNEPIKTKYPQTDWKAMAGMRDKLIHDYFGIDYEIVFDAITCDIPELLHEIQRILKLESGH